MRIVFMGSPDFAVPTLDALLAAGHEVLAVVAQPDRPKGRGKKVQSPATIERARVLGLPTRQPAAVRRGPFVQWMQGCGADVAVVVAYGRILVEEVLAAPRLGCINVHASILPKYRGAAPIHWAVFQGETETGVCTMQMDRGLDTGDVLLSHRTRIGPNETSGSLTDRLAQMGAVLAVDTLAQLDGITPTPQDHGAHSLAPLLSRDDAQIDWTRDAAALHDHVRAFHPWPVAWSDLGSQRLKIWSAQMVEGSGPAGTVIEAGARVVVAAGEGALELIQVQLPGGRAQSGSDLVNSGRLMLGQVLGEEG
jgi:methionyl-tRNA formyltransferase